MPLTYLGDRESAANLSQGVEVSRSGYRGPGTLSKGYGAPEPSVLEGALGRRPPFQACAVSLWESEFSDSVLAVEIRDSAAAFRWVRRHAEADSPHF